MIIIISNPEPVTDESTIINDLFDAGMELFHLRKPEITKEKLKTLLLKIGAEHYSKIALHQHHELAEEFGIKRLHYTEKIRMELKEFKKENCVLSTSVHSMKDYKSLSPDFEYAFFGPVFNSISKINYTSVIADGFKLSQYKTSTKIIALGGIDEENVDKSFEMGFDGVAVLGAIWQEPGEAVNNFKTIFTAATS
jgi:thiamine-phosphate pyrophosphorylase